MADTRRKLRRVAVQLDGHWKGLRRRGALCQIVNLSRGGCFVRTAVQPEKSDEIVLTIYFGKKGGAMSLPATVVHRRSSGFGVKFREIKPDLRVQLAYEMDRLATFGGPLPLLR